jgi:hypothetical protein
MRTVLVDFCVVVAALSLFFLLFCWLDGTDYGENSVYIEVSGFLGRIEAH